MSIAISSKDREALLLLEASDWPPRDVVLRRREGGTESVSVFIAMDVVSDGHGSSASKMHA